jgi:pyocin large subunit-like protein
VPFLSALHRGTHFQKHGHEFGVADEFDYEQMADTFMFGPMNSDTRECTRPTGRDCRLDFRTGHFAAGYRPQVVITFFVVGVNRARGRGGMAGYFAYECARQI